MASRKRTEAALLLALVLGSLHCAHAAAANMYRYVDDNGRTVLGSSVPIQYIKNGYEIVNDRGQVIEVVPRAPTAEELATLAVQAEELRVQEEVLKVQQEADKLLLRLYRSPDEIARKRDERLALIDGQVIALTASITKAEAEVLRLTQVVASNDSKGMATPAATLETLRIGEADVARLTTQRERLQADRATAITDADRDIKRLTELLELPEDAAAQ